MVNIFVAVLFLVLSPLAMAQQGEVIGGTACAVDGDSLAINAVRRGLRCFGGISVRLYGIDAPELDQVCGVRKCGQEAAQQLGKLAGFGNAVECEIERTSAPGGTAATCKVVREVFTTNINRMMVRRGWAMAYGATPGATWTTKTSPDRGNAAPGKPARSCRRGSGGKAGNRNGPSPEGAGHQRDGRAGSHMVLPLTDIRAWIKVRAGKLPSIGPLTLISQCVPAARITSGGRIRPHRCRFDLTAGTRRGMRLAAPKPRDRSPVTETALGG